MGFSARLRFFSGLRARVLSELILKAAPHSRSQLTHPLRSSVLVAHRHPLTPVSESVHHLTNGCTFLGEPRRSGVAEDVDVDILEPRLLLRLIEQQAELRTRGGGPRIGS